MFTVNPASVMTVSMIRSLRSAGRLSPKDEDDNMEKRPFRQSSALTVSPSADIETNTSKASESLTAFVRRSMTKLSASMLKDSLVDAIFSNSVSRSPSPTPLFSNTKFLSCSWSGVRLACPAARLLKAAVYAACSAPSRSARTSSKLAVPGGACVGEEGGLEALEEAGADTFAGEEGAAPGEVFPPESGGGGTKKPSCSSSCHVAFAGAADLLAALAPAAVFAAACCSFCSR
mmetsp:Transcript_69233/g.122467  ORF Transcript_69233/g.122467 Transcript_69233/m.122467 type:complete len:232 (+) Transcript_69233:111-806(+)